ncbi:FmdB family transcriptional regulator [candidate division WOR_3 bacterium SM23_60]|uniref:FmdB family transcriptional regulator n=1 Tax=candidate division WOR_3 bacterium SM23_60 TaxID=1703780 RepID=A0A0S8GME2_UNCW3|nr:MAG: FmdB family transcriptional regulator [candidate division WOR_3 bacterium SM23_60]
MPTYEYECIKCKYRFEEFQHISEAPLKRCPKCEGQLRRLITGGAGLIFKGSGFYVTDYKRANLPEKREQKKQDLQKAPEKPKPPDKPKS